MISNRRNTNDTRQTEKYKTLSVSLSVRTEYEHDEKEEENEEENFAEPGMFYIHIFISFPYIVFI